MFRLLKAATVALSCFVTSQVSAATLFDFEGTSTTSGGALTSLSQTSGGITLSLTRPGSNFDIADLSGFGAPPSFGSRTISPFNDTSSTPFVASFSTGLKSISIQAGDYDGDSDIISLSIFSGVNGTGTLLGTTSFDYGFGSFPADVATLSLTSSTNFRSAEFIGGSPAYPNSIYFDNVSVSAVSEVPLPASAPMFGAALLALGAVGYGMKRKAKATA